MSLIPKCSFRIIGLTEENLTNIEDVYLHGVAYRKGSLHSNRSMRILRITIDDNTSADFLGEVLRNSFGDIEHDFYVSVVSPEQTAIVNIPQFVLDLHKVLGGQICFSYTCTYS